MNNTEKINLLDYTSEKLRAFFQERGEKPFRATQIIKWIHQHSVDNFSDMTNVSKTLRAELESIAEIRPLEIAIYDQSSDGTRKWLLRLPDGNCIETVFIPEDDKTFYK